MEREHTELVIFALVARELAVFAKEDEVICAVPFFDHVEALVDLAPQSRLMQVAAVTFTTGPTTAPRSRTKAF